MSYCNKEAAVLKFRTFLTQATLNKSFLIHIKVGICMRVSVCVFVGVRVCMEET